MAWGYALIGMAVVLAVWLVFRNRRHGLKAEIGRDKEACLSAPEIRLSDAVEFKESNLPPAHQALSGCLERLLGGEGAGCQSLPTGHFALSEPPLPQSLIRGLDRLVAGSAGSDALAHLDHPEASPITLAKILGSDPILTGNVLKLANSPLFGFRSKVASVESAIGIMGIGNLKTLLCIEIAESGAAKAGMSPALRSTLWDHVGKTAVLARMLAPAFPGLDANTLSTLGILHDIGKLVLYGPGFTDFLPDLTAEYAEFNVNHAVAGWFVCHNFNFPITLCNAIRLHHAPFFVDMEDLTAEPSEIGYALALGIADALAHGLDNDAASARPPIHDSYKLLYNEPKLSRLVAGMA